MPAPRKPTALLKLTGAMDRNKQRYASRATEPKPQIGIGEPPKWLDRSQRATWRDLQAEIVPGVLTRQDRQAFALLCCLLSQFRATPETMPTSRISQMNSLLGQFAMTPATRSRVAVIPGPREPNRFANNGKRPDTLDANPFEEFRARNSKR